MLEVVYAEKIAYRRENVQNRLSLVARKNELPAIYQSPEIFFRGCIENAF
jgi:hypothetical protein